MKNDIDVLALSLLVQRTTTELLKRHRRQVAANTVMPSATLEQRQVALGGHSDEELIGRAKRAGAGTLQRTETRAAGAFEEAEDAGVSVWALVEERSGNYDSWYTFKAGVQRYLEDELAELKRQLDRWQRERRAKGPTPQSDGAGATLMARMEVFAGALQQVPLTAPDRFVGDGKSRRSPENSKSKSIRTASDEWRERAAEEMSGNLRLLFLLECVTGCRPQELENGVQARLLRDGTIVTRVKGAKTDDIAGQPTRFMRLVASDGITQCLARQLKVGCTLNSRMLDLGKVNTYAKRVARACARAFPKRTGRAKLSCYSIRHQFKADLKAGGWSAAEVAMAMGHSTTRSGTAYGRGGHGAGGGVKPLVVRAARAVKLRAKPPIARKAATAKAAASNGRQKRGPRP
jgi:integrase